jgi:NAD(P)-dependent dehydrogenase (short-subunit alcohol dehydrogenase family)
MTELKGRRVVITGAATGIGWAMAQTFRDRGAVVAMMDIDGDRIGGRVNSMDTDAVTAIQVDVSDPHSVATACTEAARFLGGIDVLVNNAATFTPVATVTDLTVEQWNHAIAVNLTGAFLMCQAAIPVMKQAGSGVIINVASQLGSVAAAGRAPYCAAKGGIIQLTKVLALDHAADGIRVNSLSPGAVLTERLVRMFGSPEAAVDTLAPKHPMGRLGETAEIASAACFLASDDASFMTGSDMLVDGGYNAQ